MSIVLEPSVVATGQTANSGNFNGLAWGPGTPYHLFQSVGLEDLPTMTSSDLPYAQDHGSYVGLDLMTERDITLTFNVYANDQASFDALMVPFNAAFQPSLNGVEQPLIFSGLSGVTQQVNCRCRKRGAPRQTADAGVYRQVPVQLSAMDPRIYSSTPSIAVLGLSTGAASGIAWPVTWPISWGATTSTNYTTLVNSGSFTTPWMATIQGPVANPIITNATTGQTIGVTITLSSTDVLTIDFGARTVILNGTASRRSSVVPLSSWWKLPPGQTNILFTASVSTAGTLTASWRAAWV